MDIQKFREIRLKSQLTQADIALMANVNRLTISRIENGLHSPRPLTRYTLEKLATTLEKRWLRKRKPAII